MDISSKKVIWGSATLVTITALSFAALFFIGTHTNFMVAKLGFKLATAEQIGNLIMAGATAAQIVGVVGAGTGIGLVLAGAIGTLKAVAKKQGYRALINF